MQLPTITNKQKEILLLLHRFRFLNRIQIQTMLRHKDPKNTNVWLKDLTDKNYTSRIFERKAGINEPAIYFIDKNGIKFFSSAEGADKKSLRKLYQEKRRSQAFIDQCILIAQVYIKLQDQNLPGFKFYTQSDFPSNGLIRDLLPSFAYVVNDNENIKHYTCEIIKENTPRFAIRSRIEQFIEFFKDQPDMTIVFISQSEKLRQYIEKHSAKVQASEETELHIISSLI
ncbi:replication-relaxation family protein [Candidatus Roizmanbacteria bacterium]|nr:MAG: replication-relaxation family protein [Candidatus Roizmanbacteria bacterium]